MIVQRFKLTIAYDGTNFCGWQKQEPPDGEPLRSVQGVVEDAVIEALRMPVVLNGASRTDSGVHAVGQVGVFSADTSVPIEKMAMAINSRLPDDVQIRSAEIVDEGFNPIIDCISKGYRYSIVHGVSRKRPAPLFDRHFVYQTWYELNVNKMNEGANHLLGEHDFASFAQINHGRETTVRTIIDCSVKQTEEGKCHIDVSGNGFLYNMVRIIAGTLAEVGRGKYEPEQVKEMLEACDRRAAGPTLPPEGLCLMWVKYSD